MEEVLKETAKQVPALLILVLLSVGWAKALAVMGANFLQQLTETRAAYLAQTNSARADYLAAIDRFHSDTLQDSALSRAAIKENSVASDNQSKAINALTGEVRELRGTINDALRNFVHRP